MSSLWRWLVGREPATTPVAEPAEPGAAGGIVVGAGVAALAFIGVMVVVGWRGYHQPAWGFALAEAVGLSLTTAGWIAWLGRPSNRTGPLMMAAGVCWYLTNLQYTGQPPLYAVGYWLTYLDLVVLAHLALVYPRGRLTSGAERVLLAAAYLSYLVLQGGRYLSEGAASPIGWHPSPLSRWADLLSLNALVFGTLFWMLVVRRWLRAGRAARRQHGPVWFGILLTNAVLGAGALASLAHRGDIGQLLVVVYGGCLLALPFVVLVGILQDRLAQRRVAGLMIGLDQLEDPAGLRDLLARALDDPTVALAFRSDEGEFSDIEGRPVRLPEPDNRDRTVTMVWQGERPLAALVHDSSLANQSVLVAAVVAAARLAISNAQLQALQTRHLAELHASRERIAVAALQERRRIERDLHDGAQQRLLRLSWLAQQAQGLASSDRAAAPVVPVLDELLREVRQTTAELRDLAQGIHSSIVTTRGLAAAVEEFAVRAPLTLVVDLPAERHAEAVEATAFFVIMEAVVNAAKHARVDRVDIHGRRQRGDLIIDVVDEGVGGADPRRGTGLRNMSDRLVALGGSLSVSSRPGAGTWLRMRLPCG
jgi:signal transduction histidine kinase